MLGAMPGGGVSLSLEDSGEIWGSLIKYVVKILLENLSSDMIGSRRLKPESIKTNFTSDEQIRNKKV